MSDTIPKVTTTQWSSKDDSKLYAVHNPTNGKVLAEVAGGDAQTVESAVAASKEAFSSWRWVAPMQRGALLLKCADVLEARKEELARLLCLENGKPYQDALALDLSFLTTIFRYFGSLVGKIPSEFYDRGVTYSTVVREPHGVCVGILPFNWPPVHTGGKLAPCIAAGNTMILKPGDQAPLTVIRIVEILQEVLPPNVVMAVPGLGVEVPQALIRHRDVRAVSFTGSSATGAAVQAAAAPKPCVLELGGKNAMVIFEDADLELAVAYALEGAYFNKGEACTAASRLLVHESVHDEFVRRLSAGVKRIITGNGMSPSTHVGPTVSKASQQRVLGYIEKGLSEGARIAAQGPLPSDSECENGYFVPPTLFVDVKRDMTIAQDEIFGPVTCVLRFGSEEEAVSIANESTYGLTAIVFSRDSERCSRVTRKLDAGMIWVNNYFRNALGVPFGGVKDSGHGREHCMETLKEWTTAKAVHQPSGLGDLVYWRGVKDCFPSGTAK